MNVADERRLLVAEGEGAKPSARLKLQERRQPGGDGINVALLKSRATQKAAVVPARKGYRSAMEKQRKIRTTDPLPPTIYFLIAVEQQVSSGVQTGDTPPGV